MKSGGTIDNVKEYNRILTLNERFWGIICVLEISGPVV
jgi:hypothetical protein